MAFSKDQLLEVVAEWLRTFELPKMAKREIPEVDLGNLRSILAIVGPRRAGKTFFLYQLIQELLESQAASRSDILFVDFEDYRLQGFQAKHMNLLLEAHEQLAGHAPRFLFLDEIQRVPDWSRLLRTLHNRGKYKLLVSGSNSSLLAGEIATELRGRYREERILPFSFRQVLGYRGLEANPAAWYTPERGRWLGTFDEYLRFGGFPETLSIPQEREKRKLIQSYFNTLFYLDIMDRHGIRARYVIEPMMRSLLEDYATLFSISTFAKNLRTSGMPGSKRTIANYLAFLEEAFFVIALEKFSFSPRKRMMNPRKVYLIDSGFGLLGGVFGEKRGALLENIVAVELFRNQRRTFYFKERNECDFIVQDGTKLVEAWQVCWEVNAKNERRELRGLVEAMDQFQIPRGGILTYDQEETRLMDGRTIQLMPVWKWLL